MLARLLLVGLAWLAACPQFGARLVAQGPSALDVYVDPTGSDSTGDGTANNPFRTLQRGHDAVDAGGTVHVRAGAYPFRVTISKALRVVRDGAGVVNVGPPDVGSVTVAVGASDVTLLDLAFAGGAAVRAVERTSGDRLRVERCSFVGTSGGAVHVLPPGGTGHQLLDLAVRDVRALPAAVAVSAQAATGLRVERCRFEHCDFGVRLDGCAGASLSQCSFVDLLQTSLHVLNSPDLACRECRVTRCGHFATPTGQARPADAFAAVVLVASPRALLQRSLLEDCGGYVGKNSYRAGAATTFDGCFALGVFDSADVRVEDSALHRNRFGGVWVGGASTGLVLANCNLVANGSDNDTGKDVGVYSDGPAVTATPCFWGVPSGPVLDGVGLGNGVLGATVTTAPFAAAPFDAQAFAVVVTRDAPAADRGVAVAAADLTGDGWQEVITLGDRAATVEVQVNGPAGFTARETTLLSGARPVALATGLLDADTFRDVVVADDVGHSVQVLLGDGAGRLPVVRVVPVSRRPTRLLVAELDGQPGADVAVACQGDAFGAGGLLVLRNDGAGNLTASVLSGAVAPVAVAAVDLDADADLDLVAFDLDPAGPALLAFVNGGAGSFTASWRRPFDAHPLVDASLVVFDQDGGPLDLGFATFQLTPLPGVSRVRLLRGDGTGGFGAAILLRERSGPLELHAARLGGAAAASLLAVDRSERQLLLLGPLANDASASFPYAQVVDGVPLAAAVAPLTNRTTADLAVVDASRGRVLVERGRRAASVSTYGTGCVGGSGVPRAQWASLPQLGSATFALAFDNAAANSGAVLVIGALAADIPLPGGCRLLVDPLLNLGAFSDAAGAGYVPLAIPDSPTLLGSELVGQWFVLDPAGGLFATFSMTQGLRVSVGG